MNQIILSTLLNGGIQLLSSWLGNRKQAKGTTSNANLTQYNPSGTETNGTEDTKTGNLPAVTDNSVNNIENNAPDPNGNQNANQNVNQNVNQQVNQQANQNVNQNVNQNNDRWAAGKEALGKIDTFLGMANNAATIGKQVFGTGNKQMPTYSFNPQQYNG